MRHTALFLLLCLLGSFSTLEGRNYTRLVNLFIGTGGHGHTHPAAVVPHGMIQPGPDTRRLGWDACSGYHYSDTTINGFAHTRLSGTGCADFGDFLLMPTVGTQDVSYVQPKEGDIGRCPYASSFSHENEKAEPGYYSVLLERYGVRAEMTATERTALHRFTFPRADKAGFILDLDYAIQEQYNLEMDVEVVDSFTVRARRRSLWWAYNQELFFVARFSRPFTYDILRDTVKTERGDEPRCKLLLHFATREGEQVLVKASVSAVDYVGAERNLDSEQPAWDFEGTRSAASRKWNEALACIDVQSKDSEDCPSEETVIFYTALYHSLLAPSIFCDVDGRFRGMDLAVHTKAAGEPAEANYTVFSLWDTFRALHPLLSIIDPAANEAYIRNLIRKGEEGGIVPKWDCASNYTGCMIGYHFASLVADAYAKGYRNFDVEKAYKACRRMAEYNPDGLTAAIPRWKLKTEIMPAARLYKNERGYIPCDLENESVAKALEYAYDDWCISQLAEGLGDREGAARYAGLSEAWKNYYDDVTGFMRGVDSLRNWRTPFDPCRSTHRADDYCEGNAWQWTWFVPHDVEGLMRRMGGKKVFLCKLDSLFSVSSELTGENVSADISGLVGQYAHGNEPSHHVIHLYNYAGRPHRTQELADSILHSLYAAVPDGLSGNEDCGQMSAWYLLNAMGFYQVCPGRPVYSIGRPLFDRTDIRLSHGKTFSIRTSGNSREAKYIKSVRLNGKRLRRPFFTHAELTEGGVMEIEMSRRPTKWGR
ncbi:MAG TPA: GH92 family glycosyl hydrolase [Alloprevotella sp.]|nr:GH92 family glycosyl hydrolase [Alloprevotella sp.]